MTFTAVAKTVGIETSFSGSGQSLNGEIDLTTKRISFKYDLWDIDTGIQLRNDHMHENYLETEKFPTAEFKGTISSNVNGALEVQGVLTLHGIKNRITAKGRITKNLLAAYWKLDLTDYNISIPRRFYIAKISKILEMKISCLIKETK